ncbi:MAG: waaD [Chlamydiales bacterium]|jgi:ADP-L-glycero-D-manno-heptose 6-epimerase|nr:waaD [Chlamydiales bacterium]
MKTGIIVLTGGAGFIGSHVLRCLNQQGYKDIIIVDDLGHSAKWRNLVGQKFLDILPINGLFSWLEGKAGEISAFIHLGACSSTTETNADYLLDNNYRYSVRLAEYALYHRKRFIYASSAATYGKGDQGFSDEHDRLELLRPLNMYGYSKHLFDLWLKQEGVLNQVVGLKYFNVFGPGEAHKASMASAILRMVPQALYEGKIKLFKSNDPKYKDGEQVRDFIYVKDAATMTCQFLNNSIGGIFNIGTGIPSTWNALAEGVIAGLQKQVLIEYIDMPASLSGQYQNYTCADMAKYCRTCNLANVSTTPLRDAVIEYVRDYLLKENLVSETCQRV